MMREGLGDPIIMREGLGDPIIMREGLGDPIIMREGLGTLTHKISRYICILYKFINISLNLN
jgi:hypothetical protein